MKIIMFILSLFILICTSGMFYGAIIKDSPIRYIGIFIMSIVFLLSIVLTITTYKEMCKNFS